MKRLPILICVILVSAIVLWMIGNPSDGQTRTGIVAVDAEAGSQRVGNEELTSGGVTLAQNDAVKNDPAKNDAAKKETQNAKIPKKEPKVHSAEALAFFQRARQKLFSYKTIRASLEEKVVIGDRRFKAEGFYVQGSSLQGDDLKLRLEFRISLGAEETGALQGELEQVSDGEFLWTRHLIGKKTRVSRRNIRQILDAAKARGNTPQDILVAQLGLGGLPAILASIERTMIFDSITEEELGGKPFIVISATWSEEYLKRSTGLTEEVISNRLPDFIPDSLQITFEKENLFPRRILYLKKHLTRDISLPMVDLQFREIKLNEPVDDEVFVFKAPQGVFQNDLTSEYLRRLQQSPQPGQPGNTSIPKK